MTGTSSEDHAAVRFPPPLLPLATVLIGVSLQWLWPIQSIFPWSATTGYAIGGVFTIAVLVGLGLLPVILFRRSGQSEIPWKPTPSIIVRGPYKFTRNPMYLQMVLICIGIAIILSNVWILMLTPVCGVLLQICAIRPEEAYLERKFGDEYRAYKQRVRRWI